MIEDNSQKNITDKWLDNIFKSLENLDLYQRRLRNGCMDLMEYINSLGLTDNLDKIRYQNAGIMITEFRILLDNVKKIINEKEFELLSNDLKFCEKVYSNKLKLKDRQIDVYDIVHNEVEHESKFVITPYFELLSDQLCELRERIVSNLSNILFLPGNVRGGLKHG